MGEIFITGGAGYIGRHLIERYYSKNRITVYSRDESKHYFLKKQYPMINCVVGDIRNYDLLRRSMIGHSYAIFAASMKQIEACDQNPEEAAQIILMGALNARRAVDETKSIQNACYISTDKSRAATTIYGALKFAAGESFILNPSPANVSCAIYGNVLGSSGSIIPLIKDTIARKGTLSLYGENMTRFTITAKEAVDLIDFALGCNGVNIIPKLKSYRVKDMVEIYQEKAGLNFHVSSPRIGEKQHEIMIGEEEMSRAYISSNPKYYIVCAKSGRGGWLKNAEFPNREYSSRDCIMSKEELESYLIENGML